MGVTVEENLQLMATLDDAWNSQDWDTFKKRHAEEVAVYWPGQPEPTRGKKAHHEEAVQFFKIRTYAVELKNQQHQPVNCIKRYFNPQSLP